jgi:branched-chain amino acid transport system permease protein
MATQFKLRISHIAKAISAFLGRGINLYIFLCLYLMVATLWVYFLPRSLLAFLMFVSAAGLTYALKLSSRFKLVLGLIIALVLVPIIGERNIFLLEVIFQMSVFSALALGLNIVVGFAGLLNMGYAAFYAVGAYTWAIFGSQQLYLLHSIPGASPIGVKFLLPPDAFYLFIFVGVITAAIAGLLLGLPVMRLRGDYLAIVTLGFGEVIRVVANNLGRPLNLTGGSQGITPIQRPTIPMGLQNDLNLIFTPLVGHPVNEGDFYNLFFYLAALVVILVIILVVTRLDDSKIGRAWTAIREDETAAEAMGVPLVPLKLAAFMVGASFAGVMGVLVAANRTFISPESFDFMQSIGVLAMVILGGLGSIPGVIVGACVTTLLNLQVLQSLSLSLAQLRQSDAVIPIINFPWKNLSSQVDPAQYQRMLFGLILIFMMIYRREGLIPAARHKALLTGSGTETGPNEEDQRMPAASMAGQGESAPIIGKTETGEVDHGAA